MESIYFLPRSAENSYVCQMQKAYEGFGVVGGIRERSILLRIFSPRSWNQDVIVFNWYENRLIDQGGNTSLKGLLKLVSLFLLCRWVFRQVLFCRHNVYPHGTSPKSRQFVSRACDLLERLATASYAHSPVICSGPRKYVPHPLYVDGLACQNKSSPDAGYYVAFGRIDPYKKLDELVSDFPEGYRLKVVGPCKDESYVRHLKSIASDNVEFDVRFISDEEARDLVRESSGLIITHDNDSMVVSGSFFFAMSCGTKAFMKAMPFSIWASEALGSRVAEAFCSIDDLFMRISAAPTTPDAWSEADIDKVNEMFSLQSVKNSLKDLLA